MRSRVSALRVRWRGAARLRYFSASLEVALSAQVELNHHGVPCAPRPALRRSPCSRRVYSSWNRPRSQRPRPASPVASKRTIRKEAQGLGSSHTLGLNASFPCNGVAAPGGQIERRAPMRAMSERAGYLISSGTEPPLCAFRTLAAFQIQPHENVFERGGGPQTGDAQLTKHPAKSESHCLHGLQSLDLSPFELRPLFLGNGECPHLPIYTW